jgi:predicted 2-oxoglutarate/Fe(II)-dependent dioxygenase YbiX
MFKDCFYLIEQLRPAGWMLNPDILQEIDEKLARTPWIRGVVDRAKERAAESALKPSNRGNRDRKQQQKKKINAEASEESSLTEMAAFAVNMTYKLQNCWTLDSAADVHVCNDLARFQFERTAGVDDVLFAGKDAYDVQAYGTVILTVQTLNGTAKIKLLNVALMPGFLTNLVALRRFVEKGVH